MPTHLAKRGATYYFRRVVPDDLRPAFEGKRELTYSLKTKDRKEAERLCRIEGVKTDDMFAEARAKLVEAPQAGDPPSQADNPAIDVGAYAAAALAGYRRERQRYAERGDMEAFKDRLKEQLSLHQAILDGDFDPVVPLDHAEGMVIAIKALLTGDGVLAIPQMPRPIKAVVPKEDHGPVLSVLVDKWAAEKMPTAKSVEMWRRTCALFYEVVGEMPVGAIAKRDILKFKDHLIEDGKSRATVDNRLNQLRALFRYAVANDIIPLDPAAGVKVTADKRPKEARVHFDAPALAAIFGGPVHAAGERPSRGAGEASYWLPLLALYTGARLNELGQLRPKDVARESYRDGSDVEQSAWVINIVEDQSDGLTLKNKSSARRVPIHAALIDLGFLRYVEAARSKGQARLFPDLRPDRFGTVTGNWGKWFTPYLRNVCKVTDTRMVFHSFRHSFKHYARECDLAKGVNDAITGHESGDVADAYGGLEYPLRPLVEGMGRYRVPGFKLPPAPVT